MTFFEVQHFTLASGWVNTWCDEKGKPILFSTKRDARRELRQYLADLKADINAGNIRPYDKTEFRVSQL